MKRQVFCLFCWSVVISVVIGAAGVAAAVDTPVVTVTSSDLGGFVAAIECAEPALEPVKTAEGEFLRVTWPDTPITGEIGAPALPVVRRLFAVPPGASVEVSWERGSTTTIRLGSDELPWRVLPVQPPIPKLPGARENAKFQYDAGAYVGSPERGPRVIVTEVGLVRGERLLQLEAQPMHYDPTEKTLTWYSSLSATVKFGLIDDRVVRRPVAPGLARVIVNPEVLLTGIESRGSGEYLIVVDTGLQSTITPFADAKAAQGFTVSTHVVDGDTNSQIKNWIQTQWDGGTTFDYLLLVGDTDTVPHWTGSGNGSPDTDLYYGCMDGAGDYLADIGIGRFSARTVDALQDIINKTLYFENGPLADPDYLKRAVYMAGSDSTYWDFSEATHNYCITTHMNPNGYTSDRLYEVTYDATTQDVRNSFNNGRGFGIFSGHGGTYSWADGPPFSQSDVNGLTNANMYSMVWSFACITGTYTVSECFTETWLRAAGKGAVTVYGSSVNSYWDEDDILERRLFDVIFDNSDDVPTEVGPVWNETNLRFVAHFGAPAPGNDILRYLEMYNLMGDPSLRLPSACSDAGTVSLDSTAYTCEDKVTVAVSDCGLNLDDNTIDTVTVDIDSTTETGVEEVLLIETDAASADFRGTIDVSATDDVGILQVAEGDTITVTYLDADDGQGGTNVPVTTIATVDCTPPGISNVRTTTVEARRAVVEFDANEPVIGRVHYGTSCAALSNSASSATLATAVQVEVSTLAHSTTYYYAVEAEDAAGHIAGDDNGGSCYSFSTLQLPEFYTEIFGSSDNDLDDLSLTFVPDGSGDFYDGCTVEGITTLPVDPSGGTTVLADADDASVEVTLTGGATVSLYGQSYTSLYIGSNGYVTFGAGDSDYSETTSDHFDTPRISGLFDDLEPRDGGTISYKQLGDRMVVTFEGVPEYSYDNPNPNLPNIFQIEIHFDGTIVLSYLDIAAADGLAGLSEGVGQDLEFVESDLSNLGACGPLLFQDGFETGDCGRWSVEVQ
ncbi:MAG: hypothetical protein K8R59_14605 [Thermoanaerobaculales bacterium]|nr:hypothetical protein [Thermoanaerobaculales bacterium]